MTSLNRRLVLEERARAADGAGGFTGAWTALGVHWGAMRPVSGRLERGDEVARSRGRYRITIRAVPVSSEGRPEAGQRFREGTRIYAIRSVLDGADARFLTCLVDEEFAT